MQPDSPTLGLLSRKELLPISSSGVLTQFYPRRAMISGAVKIDRIVDSVTAFDAKTESLSNISANMDVFAAQGMAAAVTTIAVTTFGASIRLKIP